MCMSHYLQKNKFQSESHHSFIIKLKQPTDLNSLLQSFDWVRNSTNELIFQNQLWRAYVTKIIWSAMMLLIIAILQSWAKSVFWDSMTSE